MGRNLWIQLLTTYRKTVVSNHSQARPSGRCRCVSPGKELSIRLRMSAQGKKLANITTGSLGATGVLPYGCYCCSCQDGKAEEGSVFLKSPTSPPSNASVPNPRYLMATPLFTEITEGKAALGVWGRGFWRAAIWNDTGLQVGVTIEPQRLSVACCFMPT